MHQIALKALDKALSLGDFIRRVEMKTCYPVELRGPYLTLWRSVADDPDIRLSHFGIRRLFWTKFITVWTEDFAAYAAVHRARVLAYVWKGMLGRRMTPDQFARTKGYAEEAGLIEAAQALCAVIVATPEWTPVGETFERFSERCRGLIEERRRQGLPPPHLPPVAQETSAEPRRLTALQRQRLRKLEARRWEAERPRLYPGGQLAAIVMVKEVPRATGKTDAATMAELTGRPCPPLWLDGVQLAWPFAVALGHKAGHASTSGPTPVQHRSSAPRRLMVSV